MQTGTVDDVWRSPVDAEAARFLGYATVLEGEAARVVLAAGGAGHQAGPVAVRRSALRHAVDGPLAGRVLAARMTPDVVRLTVAVDGVGELPAVAERPGRWRSGSVVRLVVDLTRTARLGGSEAGGGTP